MLLFLRIIWSLLFSAVLWILWIFAGEEGSFQTRNIAVGVALFLWAAAHAFVAFYGYARKEAGFGINLQLLRYFCATSSVLWIVAWIGAALYVQNMGALFLSLLGVLGIMSLRATDGKAAVRARRAETESAASIAGRSAQNYDTLRLLFGGFAAVNIVALLALFFEAVRTAEEIGLSSFRMQMFLFFTAFFAGLSFWASGRRAKKLAIHRLLSVGLSPEEADHFSSTMGDALLDVKTHEALDDYIRQHAAAIAAMEQEFTRYMGVFNFQPDFTAQLLSARQGDCSYYMAYWHQQGLPGGGLLAALLFKDMLKNRQAGTVEFFTHHALKKTPLDAEKDRFSKWRYYMVHGIAENILSLVLVFTVLSAMYFFVTQRFMPSDDWIFVSCIVAFCTVCYVYVRGYFQSSAIERRALFPDFRRRAYDLLWAMPLLLALCWGGVLLGLGGAATLAGGTVHQTSYAYVKDKNRRCLNIESAFALYTPRICIERDLYKALPAQGQVEVKVWETWFGVTLSEMEPAF